MILFAIVFCGCLLNPVLSDQTITLTDEDPSYTWKQSSEGKITIEADEGYQIAVHILYLNLDGENNNMVTIENVPEDGEGTEEMMFTYILSNMSYFFNYNKLLAQYVGTNSSNNFSIEFTRQGKALTTTTTEISTTTEFLPTPAETEKSTITVYIYGKASNEYNKAVIVQLKNVLANMGQDYCSVQVCPLNGSITTNNINIQTLVKCSVLWENYDTCASLTFGIPVNILEEYQNNSLWENYQLNEKHLQIMWSTYASKYLETLGLSVYPVPNIESIFRHKSILFCFVIVFFVIIILVIRRVTEKINKKRIKRKSDAVSIMDSQNRISQASLTPHYLQELPPLFSTDFPLYPEQKSHNANYGEFNETFTDDLEDNYNIKNNETITIVGDLEELDDTQA
ncbi:uncharacterized protein LOC115889299 [Sitophilus oryzae]|uniref:Uncharacterized protein LOC115889299 n=1 Tax=Sitophilus oryzae TaxID=7048 RepID=A0A6J2YP88_SITOR|nr:uncharacterized protein LOC115889299 [Sitophilus oryzae]